MQLLLRLNLFAQEIRKINKNVFILPNAINEEESNLNKKLKSDKLRFGWLGGSSHLHDLMLLDGATSYTLNQFKDDFKMYVCGFDIRGPVTELNQRDGRKKTETN